MCNEYIVNISIELSVMIKSDYYESYIIAI
jgi:hypothetical protein